MRSPLSITILVGLEALGISWATFGGSLTSSREWLLLPICVFAGHALLPHPLCLSWLLNTIVLFCLSVPQIISDQKPECWRMLAFVTPLPCVPRHLFSWSSLRTVEGTSGSQQDETLFCGWPGSLMEPHSLWQASSPHYRSENFPCRGTVRIRWNIVNTPQNTGLLWNDFRAQCLWKLLIIQPRLVECLLYAKVLAFESMGLHKWLQDSHLPLTTKLGEEQKKKTLRAPFWMLQLL